MKTLENYSANALASFEARHKAEDSLLFNCAAFYNDGANWVATVRDHVVFESKRLSEVLDFVGAHNLRINDSLFNLS